MHRKLSVTAALATATLGLAQIAALSPSLAQTYLGTGTPTITGTHTPEQSPATSVQMPVFSAPYAATPGPAISESTNEPEPGLSFGAASAPIVSPNR
jgi:hypothetical protein